MKVGLGLMTATSTLRTPGKAFVVAALVLNAAITLAGFGQPLTQSRTPPQPVEKQGGEQKAPQDPLGRTSPYETLTGFLKAGERGEFSLAAEYLDSRGSLRDRQEQARTLIHVLNVGLQIDLGSVSRAPEGDLLDGLPPTRELVGTIRDGDRSIKILLDRVQRRRDAPLIWLFSAETLRHLPEFATGTEGLPWLQKYLPAWSFEKTLWGIPLYRYILVPLFLLLSYGIARLATWIFLGLVRFVFRRPLQKYSVLSGVELRIPVLLLFCAVALSIGSRISTTLISRYVWAQLANVFLVIAITWLILRIIGVMSTVLTVRLTKGPQRHRVAVVQLSCAAAQALIVAVAALAVLKLLGFDLSTAIAGLGIGGLALAFAAQKTIENLFGTVMLVTDQPVRVGDFCQIGDSMGTIEDIGFRSTRIRTLQRTVVCVPNGQVASMVVENYTLRDKMLFNHRIGLRRETSADQLRYVTTNIQDLLAKHPKVESETARIRFEKFGDSSLDLEIFAYVFTHDLPTFLEIQESLLVRLMDVIEASGTGIAFPSRTAYLATDREWSPEEAGAAIRQTPPGVKQRSVSVPQRAQEHVDSGANPSTESTP